MDTKKKELVGPFKNAGRIWSREPLPVNDHDFRSQAKGMAIPRGLYDALANRGSVLIGTSHDTPQFAVDAIVDWWRSDGRRRYRQSEELLILADSGGSNGARCRLWKYPLPGPIAGLEHAKPCAAVLRALRALLLWQIDSVWRSPSRFRDFRWSILAIADVLMCTADGLTWFGRERGYPGGRWAGLGNPDNCQLSRAI